MTEEVEKKPRKKRSDAGKPRPRPVASGRAPIEVRLKLRGEEEEIEFGCARRWTENGFHVFVYPCPTDPYKHTRREFAISEIVELECTSSPDLVAAPQQTEAPRPQAVPIRTLEPAPVSTGPVIRNARKSAADLMARLESSDGPIAIDELPGLVMGDSSV